MTNFCDSLKFYRNFPGPPDVSDAEKCALARRYSIPSHPGKVDYRRFQSDISQLNIAEEIAKHGTPDKVLNAVCVHNVINLALIA